MFYTQTACRPSATAAWNCRRSDVANTSASHSAAQARCRASMARNGFRSNILTLRATTALVSCMMSASLTSCASRFLATSYCRRDRLRSLTRRFIAEMISGTQMTLRPRSDARMQNASTSSLPASSRNRFANADVSRNNLTVAFLQDGGGEPGSFNGEPQGRRFPRGRVDRSGRPENSHLPTVPNHHHRFAAFCRSDEPGGIVSEFCERYRFHEHPFLYTTVQNRQQPVKVWQRLERNRLVAGVREGSAFRMKTEAGESGARASPPADRGAGVPPATTFVQKTEIPMAWVPIRAFVSRATFLSAGGDARAPDYASLKTRTELASSGHQPITPRTARG